MLQSIEDFSIFQHTTTDMSWSLDGVNSSLDYPSSSNGTCDDAWLVFSPSLALWLLKAAALGLLIALTVLGNLLVVVGVASSARLRTPSYFLIVNLAVADLLLGVAVLPISAARELFDFQFDPILCLVWSSLDVLCCTASILSLCALAAERYLGVSRPLRRARVLGGPRARAALLGAPWAAAALIALAAPLAWPGGEGGGCTVNKHLGYVIFSACGSFYIPAAAMLLLWWKVYRATARRAARLAGGRVPAEGLRAHRGGAPLQAQIVKESSGRRSRRSSGWTSSEFEEPSIHMKILPRGKGRLSRSCSTPAEALTDSMTEDESSNTNHSSKKYLNLAEADVHNTITEERKEDVSLISSCSKERPANDMDDKKKINNLNCFKCRRKEARKIKKGRNDVKEKQSEMYNNKSIDFNHDQNGFRQITTKRNQNKIIHVVKCSKFCQSCSSNARNLALDAGNMTNENHKIVNSASLEFESRDVLRTLNCADQRRFSKSAKFPRRTRSCRSDSQTIGLTKSGSSFRIKSFSWSLRQSSSIRSEQSRQGKIGGQSRAARTIALVVGGFLLCWCPFFIILPIDAACPSCDVGAVFTLAFWLGYFNSCINPFIYACSSREMRRAFRAILCRRRDSHSLT